MEVEGPRTQNGLYPTLGGENWDILNFQREATGVLLDLAIHTRTESQTVFQWTE